MQLKLVQRLLLYIIIAVVGMQMAVGITSLCLRIWWPLLREMGGDVLDLYHHSSNH